MPMNTSLNYLSLAGFNHCDTSVVAIIICACIILLSILINPCTSALGKY